MMKGSLNVDVLAVHEGDDIQARLALLDTLFAHGPLGFGFIDRQFRFVRVNERLAAINGVSAEAHRGRLVAEILGDVLWKTRLPLFERVLAGEALVDITLPGPTTSNKGISERRVLASYHPVFSDTEVRGIAVVVRDVTEQSQAEDALRAGREEYRLLFDANPQPMWVYDVETLAFLAVNDAAVRVYGYSRAEFLAMEIGDIRPPEDIPALKAAIKIARIGTHTDGPWRHVRKDGSGIWVEVAANALDFEGRAARLIVTQDVTERVAMENERARMDAERREATTRQQTFMREVLSSVTEGKLLLSPTPDQLPVKCRPVGDFIALTKDAGLWDLRRRAQGAAQDAGHSESRQFELMTAASEAGMNAIVHAGGGQARVFVDETGTVQVWVEDHGTGISMENLPRAALERGFSTQATLGHGLKMMLETIDHLYLLTGTTGTTVVVEQERTEALPGWL